MRELLKRLERLEQESAPASRPLQTIVKFVGAIDGNPEPWSPTWARGDGGELARANAEAVEAFEARAKARFPAGLILMGGSDARPLEAA